MYIYIYINPLEGVQMHARIQLIKDLCVVVPVLPAGTEQDIGRAIWDGIGRAPWPLGRSFKKMRESPIADTGQLKVVWHCAGRSRLFQNLAGCRLFHNLAGCRLSGCRRAGCTFSCCIRHWVLLFEAMLQLFYLRKSDCVTCIVLCYFFHEDYASLQSWSLKWHSTRLSAR